MKLKRLHRIVFLLSGMLLINAPVFSQDPHFYIYLCFGQSNMEGQGAIEAQDQTVNSRFRVIEAVNCSNLGRKKGTWYTAVPPLCRCWSGLSPVDYFGKTMVASLPDSIKVGVINVSVAGCKIELFDKDNYQTYVSTISEDWLKNIINEYDGNPYAYLVDIAKLAQKDGVIKGILLHQGESNTGDSQWPSKVKKIYNNLIRDLSLDATTLPLLAGEVVSADQGGVCASMNSIIAKLPQTLPNSYVISSGGCTDGADNVHFNSAGYRELGKRYAAKMLSLLGYEVTDPEDPDNTESFWIEPERFVTPTAGSSFDVVSDPLASNGKYITIQGIQSISKAPSDSSGLISFSITVSRDTTYNLFARLNCLSPDNDSFWIKLDNGPYTIFDGLETSGWSWRKLTSFVLMKGKHKFTFGYREEGAMLDKICISSHATIPTAMGEPDNLSVGIKAISDVSGYALGQNYPNPFSGKTTISFKIPNSVFVSLKVYNMLGKEVIELAGGNFTSGKHTIEFDSDCLNKGIYFYTIKADKFSASQKMIIQ